MATTKAYWLVQLQNKLARQCLTWIVDGLMASELDRETIELDGNDHLDNFNLECSVRSLVGVVLV